MDVERILTDEVPGGISPEFLQELRNLINRHSLECPWGYTPDFLIADYLIGCHRREENKMDVERVREDPGGLSPEFRLELRNLINRHSLECPEGYTPDLLIADYLIGCLGIFGAHRGPAGRLVWSGTRG